MSERTDGKQFAEVTGAVRDLTSRGVRIVIDSCPNSLPPELLNTERESVIEVNELSSDEIRALPQLQELFRTLGDELSLIVLKLLGGVPAKYENLLRELKDANAVEPAEVAQVVIGFIDRRLFQISKEATAMSTDKPNFDQIFDKFKSCDNINTSELQMLGLKLPFSCNILTAVMNNTGDAVVPTNPIVDLFFKHGCDRVKAIAAVRTVIATTLNNSHICDSHKLSSSGCA